MRSILPVYNLLKKLNMNRVRKRKKDPCQLGTDLVLSGGLGVLMLNNFIEHHSMSMMGQDKKTTP